jgi:hypothetical protein
MAWTREQAQSVADEQNAALAARGAFDVVMEVKYFSEEYGYVVDGRFSVDGSNDPIWAPILDALA